VSVPAQIAVLLALTEELFDRVAFDQMPEAERAVQKAAANIPAEVCGRFESADKLSDEDRNTIIEIVREAIAPFQPKPVSKAEATPKLEARAEPNGEPTPGAPKEPAVEAKKKS
jgi:F-type H+-transporting ATPase subunit alpha